MTIPDVATQSTPTLLKRSTPEFPKLALPSSLRELAEEASAESGYPEEFIIVPGLSVLAGAIGATYQVAFSPSWNERPILWTAIVAPPGAGKSPALSRVLDPIKSFDKDLYSTYDQDYKAWDPKGGAPEPFLRRTLCDNITLEALIELLAKNPRGLLRSVDEVSEVIGGLNQYKSGKGADRQQLLALWSGDRMSRDRVKSKTVIVHEPTCSITGGIQPSKVREFLSGSDGMSERWLVVYLPDVKRKVVRDTEAGNLAINHWRRTILLLLGTEFTGTPATCELTPEAKDSWRNWNEYNDERYNECDTLMKSYWAKLSRHVARLTATLHVASAADEGRHPTHWVEQSSVDNAVAIAEWFAMHYEANLPTQENLMLPRHHRSVDDAVDLLHAWLKARPNQSATRREIRRARVAGARTTEEVDAMVERMLQTYAVVQTTEPRDSYSLSIFEE